MKLSDKQLKSLSNLLVNISTAWFVAGLVTPWFTHQQFSEIMILDGLASFGFSYLFLRVSWLLYK
jgi:hypothetical protein